MKTQIIQEFGLELLLEKNEFIHNDGYVEDLNLWKYKLDCKYDETPLPLPRNALGHCSLYRNCEELHVHLAYLRQEDTILDSFVRGHEISHGLFILNKDKMILPVLIGSGFIGNLEDLDPETKADISGICSVIRSGINVDQVIERISKQIQLNDVKRYFK